MPNETNMNKQFDLIVIGGGPGGYLAAERASEAGLRVALFEKRRLGGTCLNEGCIPTKTLLYAAKQYSSALHSEIFGVTADNVTIDHGQVLKRKSQVIDSLVAGVAGKMKKGRVTVVEAAASLAGRSDENGFVVSAAGETYAASKVILAAGSVTSIPPIPGAAQALESGFVVTSRELLDIPEIPGRLVIIGGGVIGLEMADYFATVGSKVSVAEMLDKIAGPFDAEVSDILQKEMEQKGISFNLGCKVTGVTPDGVLIEDKDGNERTLPADKVLLSVGRRPATEGLGLETLHIETQRGAVVTDRHMQTNVSGIYAIGDINAKIMLAHTAYREAEVAVHHITGAKDTMRYDAIPSAIYTYSEVASVGETEQTAKDKGLNYTVKKLPMIYAGRYLAEVPKGNGICKLIVDDAKNRVLGVSLIGSYASEIILAATMMVETGLPADTFKEVVFAHPTVGEIIRETLFT
jgi:dihydrolipoamide dehydrogenase